MKNFLKLILLMFFVFGMTTESFAKSKFGGFSKKSYSSSFSSKSKYGSPSSSKYKSSSSKYGSSSSKYKSLSSKKSDSPNSSYGTSTQSSQKSNSGYSNNKNTTNTTQNSKYGSSKTIAAGGAAVAGGGAVLTDSLSTPSTETTSSSTSTPKYGSPSSTGTTSTTSTSTPKYGSPSSTGTPYSETKSTQTYKKPEMSDYEKEKNIILQKQASVNDNKPKQNVGGSDYKDFSAKRTNNENYYDKPYTTNNNSYKPQYRTDYDYKLNYPKKTYHYNNSTPYGGNYNNYGVGGYYSSTLMNYLPAMILVSMLNSDKDYSYEASKYYKEKSNEPEMKMWFEEMRERSLTNEDIRRKFAKISNYPPNESKDRNYSKFIEDLSSKIEKDKSSFNKSYGTKLILKDSDKIMKDEVIFLPKK